ncbi:MAG: T9SS type A sorting domain-containing protein, partial [Bacteroidetes bacterium]|nr:T9SS type A sorting domain-containing protein [Bacteroidota bacterium]
YSWNTSPKQSAATATNLIAGNYTIIVTDSNGCVKTASVIINQPLDLTVNISSIENSNCSGVCNGFAKVISVGNGSQPYTYQWDSLAKNQTTNIASNLCAGTYNVTVTDATGCKLKSSATVSLRPVVNPNIYLTNLAAIDQLKLSPAFASFYSYNLPPIINANSSNPRNFVDPGKKARFKVECTNKKGNGQSIVSGICKVRSNSPYITITDSSSALNNIGWNNKAWSADEFEIDINPNTPPGTKAYIDFVVQENGSDYTTSCIAIPIRPLVYSQTTPATIDDDNNPDSRGNDNDICDTNEIIEFYPWLDNASQLNAEYVRGKLENLDKHNFITIWDSVAGVNTTVYNSTWWNFGFGKPQTINSFAQNTPPEYDFVFKYGKPSTKSDFNLHMVMAGGFKLFSDTALSLVQWLLPYTFMVSGTNDSLTIAPQNVSYTSAAGSKQISISCNRTWMASANQLWVTFSKASGSGNDNINIILTSNTGKSQRSAIATFVAGSITKTINITQDTLSAIDILTLDKDTIYLPNTIMSSLLNVSSNRNWTASSNQTWATVNPSSGSGNGNITINNTANTSASTRSAVLTFTAGTKSKSVYLIQSGFTGIISLGNINSLINIYPNPTKDILNINNESEENITTKLMDMNGKLIDEFALNAKTLKQMNYSNLADGIYLIQLITEGKVMQRKLVIAR